MISLKNRPEIIKKRHFATLCVKKLQKKSFLIKINIEYL